MLSSFHRFQDFIDQFLEPLVETCKIASQIIPLKEMASWERTEEGGLKNPFFRLEGRRTTLDTGSGRSAPRTWDQPIYAQGAGSLLLILDENNHLLVRAVFEPGNTTRGYKNQGLLLCTTSKFSAGNLAQQKAQGRTPPFSDLIDQPEAQILVTSPAPGDGARADKQNSHQLVRVPRVVLETAFEALDPITQRRYALIEKEVFLEAYHRGLAGEHLRDLSSLLLFL